jgi:hypothetical protein
MLSGGARITEKRGGRNKILAFAEEAKSMRDRR